MFKIIITNLEGIQTHLGQFDTEDEMNEWLEKGKKHNWWGQPGECIIGEPIDLTQEIETKKLERKAKKDRIKELSELPTLKATEVKEALQFLLKKYHDEL